MEIGGMMSHGAVVAHNRICWSWTRGVDSLSKRDMFL